MRMWGIGNDCTSRHKLCSGGLCSENQLPAGKAKVVLQLRSLELLPALSCSLSPAGQAALISTAQMDPSLPSDGS